MEKIKDLYHQYLDQIIAWYDGLEQMYQYGVFFLLIVIRSFYCFIFYFITNRKIAPENSIFTWARKDCL